MLPRSKPLVLRERSGSAWVEEPDLDWNEWENIFEKKFPEKLRSELVELVTLTKLEISHAQQREKRGYLTEREFKRRANSAITSLREHGNAGDDEILTAANLVATSRADDPSVEEQIAAIKHAKKRAVFVEKVSPSDARRHGCKEIRDLLKTNGYDTSLSSGWSLDEGLDADQVKMRRLGPRPLERFLRETLFPEIGTDPNGLRTIHRALK